MAFAIGTQLGSLEITGMLGKGGMGEVYRARDIRLKRDVAVKVLPDEFSHDSDRVARFQREAEVLASLNHPNIAGIHGLGEADGSRFLVLELVEGETLAERIERGTLPIDEALRLARSMCEALEAAHEKGVIHRDLKPANVKVTPEGVVKVLDFGLAKAMERAQGSGTLSQSPTLSLAGTQAGMILGTAAYMSPEQAKGLNTDQRSDIFSFGAVFFEMVTGRQAFQGDSVSEVLASILAREPDLSLMPHGLNPKIYDLLRRALEKNPKRRWHAIGDLRLELETAMAEPLAKPVEAPQAAPAPKPLWKRAVPVAAAAVLTAALTIAGMRYFAPSTPKPLTRFSVTLGENQQFTGTGRATVAISPDGSQMVYVANQRLYHRAMSELEARPIPGTETWQTVLNPVFSPDGRSLAFWAVSDQTLKKIAVSGGASVTLCPVDAPYGMSWSEAGIVFGQGAKGILRVSENGGKPEVLVSAENDEVAQGPQVLPGGEVVLYAMSTGTSNSDSWDKAKIYVQQLKPGSARQLLIDGGADARYVSTGHIVYAFGGTLFAVPFDLGRLQVTGGQVPVVEGVRRSANTGSAQFSFSNTGSLIYVPGPISISGVAQITLATLGREGGLERLKLPLKAYAFPRVSPDGKRVAVSTDDAKDSNIWIYDLAGSTAPRQLTLGSANRYPVWSGNERVAFQSDREGDLGIFWQKTDGTGTAERLTKPEQGVAHIPDSWSPDGKALAYTAVKGSEAALWIYALQDKKASVFAEKAGALIGRAAFSPDGQWLAYQSSETGTNQIFVQPFPSTGAKYPLVRGGHPFWSPDGREIHYNPAAQQTAFVGITTRPTFSFGEPTIVPLSGLRSRNPSTDPRVWDVMPDGKKIIGTADAAADPASSGTPAGPQIQAVLNWFEDLKQRMSAK